MATATETRTFNHEETQQKVRHPLQLLRKYIRAYVILEGLALTIIAAALFFWIGLGVDFGLFQIDSDILNIHGFDWLLELNEIDTTGMASLACRITVLTVTVVALFALGFFKVALRWFREFNDRALALVLERRFAKELGDRLITAVELAKPKTAKKYGFSQIMIEKTITDAVKRLETLPVASVFNWRRLFMLWFLAGFVTIGLFVINLVLVSGISFIMTLINPDDRWTDPYRYCWKFFHVGTISTERNVLMMNTYWPRNSHLEVERFQGSASDPNDMRIPRDVPKESRPTLQVRALSWVIADRTTHSGWRPLLWKDLDEHKLVGPSLLAAVKIPKDFDAWQMDTDELEPNLVAALFENAKNLKKGGKSGELRSHFKKPEIQAKIADRGAADTLERWLDWTTWSFDKIDLQLEDTATREPLRRVGSYDGLEAIRAALQEIADSPSKERTLRKLAIPAKVAVSFVGPDSQHPDEIERIPGNGNKFVVSLSDLPTTGPGGTFKFRARGGNYYTAPRSVTLAPAPAPAKINIDKEEPAYRYHRVRELDQSSLAGAKQVTKDFPLGKTGDSNSIPVHHGANITVHIELDRNLRKEAAVYPRQASGKTGFPGFIRRGSDKRSFSFVINNVTARYDFTLEFIDEDNILGHRHFTVQPILDVAPQISRVGIHTVTLRKPNFRTASGSEKEKTAPEPGSDQAILANSYLITPAARIPIECSVKDDFGLVKVGYEYKYRKVDFELISTGSKKPPVLEVDAATQRYLAALICRNLQYWPGNPQSWHFGHYHLAMTTDTLLDNIRQTQGWVEGYVASPGFLDMVARRSDETILRPWLNDPKQMARVEEQRAKNERAKYNPRWEFEFRDDDPGGFDVRDFLPQLRVVDPKAGQLHYHLQIGVQAADNNVESGAPFLGDNGKMMRGNLRQNPGGYLNFVVISENELLAQIALDEERLAEKLKFAKEKVDAGLTSLLEEQSKVRSKDIDMELVLRRMSEIRGHLKNAETNLRDTWAAYQNLHKEMEFNRIDKSRMERIQETVIDRLRNIMLRNPFEPDRTGSYQWSEESLQKAHELVETDAVGQAKDREGNLPPRAPDAEAHARNMTDAHRQMTRLSDDIQKLLDVLEEGVTEQKAVELLALIERIRRENDRVLNEKYLEKVKILLKELENEDKKPMPDPKKSSRLHEQEKSLQLLAELRQRDPLSMTALARRELVWLAMPRRW